MPRRLIIGLCSIALLAAACGSSHGGSVAKTTRATTTSIGHPSTSTSPAPTSTSTATRPSLAVFPAPGNAGLASPDAAARAFGADYLSFPTPTLGAVVSTGADTAIVPVRSNPTAPITSVALKRVGAEWWVMGSVAPDLIVSSPTGGATVSSPLAISGRSTAYEAVINLEIRAADGTTSLAKGTAMGGSMGTMAPFATSLAFSSPPAPTGALVVTTISAKDGSVLEATVVALSFG